MWAPHKGLSKNYKLWIFAHWVNLRLFCFKISGPYILLLMTNNCGFRILSVLYFTSFLWISLVFLYSMKSLVGIKSIEHNSYWRDRKIFWNFSYHANSYYVQCFLMSMSDFSCCRGRLVIFIRKKKWNIIQIKNLNPQLFVMSKSI